MTKSAVVLLADGFEEIEAVTPIDVLRRAGVDVTIAGVAGRAVTGAHGVTYQTDAALENLTGGFDLVVLPGGMPGAKNLGESAPARALAERTAKAGNFLAAICAGPAMTLAPWGLLAGRKATCYPGFETHFPAGVTFVSDRVVVDGKIITSRGPGTALEFSLAIVREIVGAAARDEIARGMLLLGEGGGNP